MDQGRNFKSNLIKELCKLSNIGKACTTPYHPETTGQCKRFNQTLINILKLVGIIWNRTSAEVVDKLSSTSVDFIRSERELENMHLYGV